jgi:hypothetical protein
MSELSPIVWTVFKGADELRSLAAPLLETGRVSPTRQTGTEPGKARWWEHLLHNQRELLLKAALLFKPRVIVTDVPYHLGSY